MLHAWSKQILIILLLQPVIINGNNYATSTKVMTKLLSVEAKLLENLNMFVNQLKQKLDFIKQGLAQMRHFDLERNGSVEMQLANPWRVFALMRHLTMDWIQWHRVLRSRPEEKQIGFLRRNSNSLPRKKEILDAAKGILLITEVYSMAVDDFARGLFNGVQYNASLNGLDCYEIGLVHFEAEDFDGAIKWFDAAHNYFLSEKSVIDHQALKDIYEHKLLTLWQLNRRFDALKLLNESLTRWPNDVNLQRNAVLIRQGIYEPTLVQWERTILAQTLDDIHFRCSNKSRPMTTLHCHYNHTNNAFLRLAPIKVEQLSLSPYVVLFHEVLYDSEIDELKRLATPNLRFASFSEGSESEIMGETRTTHAHWLEDETSPTTIRVNRRITDMTRFILDDAEMLQVMNYGIGGHYYNHYDSFNESEGTTRFYERIATMLFYLSDVTQGGTTMFPNINLNIAPQKGNAILWYNLDNRGRAHDDSCHAACPVIVGSKWVMSKWIDDVSQMFIKPCWRES